MEKLKNLSRPKKVIIAIILVLLVIYLAGAYYYSSHFLRGTTINGINCSNKTAGQIESQIKKNIASYELQLKERKDLEDGLKGTDIDLTYLDNGAIHKYQQGQNEFTWPAGYFGSKSEKDIETVSYNEEKLDKLFKKFNCFKKKNIEKPVCAYPKYAGDNKYEIIPEVDGNQIDSSKLKEAVVTCISGGDETLDVDKAGCYVEPEYRKDDKEIVQLKDDMEALVKGSLTWDFSNRYINLTKYKKLIKDNKVTVDGDVTNKFIKIKNHTKAVIKKSKIEDWVISFANDSNTIYKGRRFVSHGGSKINVPSGGPYGWRLNVEKETKAIQKMMKNGTTADSRQPYYKQKAVEGTNGQLNDIGSSYVEVNLSSQSVYVYKNGSCVFSTSCVSGNTSLGRGTHTGACVIQYKQRDKVLGGPGYDYASPVRYWMPFNGGEGLHDADWRHSFGGSIYKTNGSHGCVNLSISAAATIYNIIDAGWPVIVHY